MHILIGLGIALGVLILVLEKINRAARLARSTGEAINDAQTAMRGRSDQQAKTDLLQDIDDPRLAAGVMMLAVAQYDGVLTDAEMRTMRMQMMNTFDTNLKPVEELIAEARWLARDVGDIGVLFSKLTPLIEQRCGKKERRELIAMLREVDRVGVGHVSEVPGHEITLLEVQLLKS